MRNLLINCLLFASFGVSLSACKKGGEDDPQTVAAKETVLVNSADPKEYLSSTFPAVYIEWPGGHSPHLEGQDYAEVPDPKFITGDYKLIVEPYGADSLKLYLDGSGTGPSFQKELLATVNYSLVSSESNNGAGYRYTQWVPLTSYLKALWHRIIIERKAYADHTTFTYSVNINRIGNQGPLTIYNDDRYNEMNPVAIFKFARRSAGIKK